MRFIIIFNEKAYYTNWYSPEQHLEGMIAIDIENACTTIDGIHWTDIEYDHL